VPKYEEDVKLQRTERRLGKVFNTKDKEDAVREFRCPICGKWIFYHYREKTQYIIKGQWDFDNDELAYCGVGTVSRPNQKDQTCADYYQEWLTYRKTSWKERINFLGNEYLKIKAMLDKQGYRSIPKIKKKLYIPKALGNLDY
jgi:DNA-directed RNA polymerase subunit RPC12/RpoP